MDTTPDLAEIAGLIGPSDQDRDYWREQAIQAADAAFWRGWDQGRRALLDEQQDERVKTARRIEQETALADNQRYQLAAAYLTLTGSSVTFAPN